MAANVRTSLLSRIWDMVLPHRYRLLLSLVLLLSITGLGLIGPIYAAKIIGSALPNQDLNLFFICIAVGLAVHLATTGLNLWNTWVTQSVGGRVVFDLRRRMYRHLQSLSLSFYESRGSGEIMSRMMNDVASITTLVTGTAVMTIVAVFQGIGILALLFYLNWRVALLALVVVPMHYTIYTLLRKRISHQSWKASEKTSQIYGKASEVFGAAKMVKAYASEQREVRTLIGQMREAYEIGMRSTLLSNVWSSATGVITHWGTVLIMIVCGYSVIVRQTLTIEQYLLLLMYVNLFYAPVSQLVTVVNQVIPAKVGLLRVFEIMDMAPEVEDKPVGLRKTLRGRVSFEDVGFAYPNGKQVLADITFDAEPGQKIALVGPSG